MPTIRFRRAGFPPVPVPAGSWRRRLWWAGIVLLALLVLSFLEPWQWFFTTTPVTAGSPLSAQMREYRIEKRVAAPSSAPTERRLRRSPPPVAVDPWTAWSVRMQDPMQLEAALAEAPRWFSTHRDETLLVLLHLASHGAGTIWRPDPVMARILLQHLQEDTPEMLLPTLDVAPEDQLGAPIPWPSNLFRAAADAAPSRPPTERREGVGASPWEGRGDGVGGAAFALSIAPERRFLPPAAPPPPPAVRAPAFNALMDMAGSQNVHDHVAQQMASVGASALPTIAPLERPQGGQHLRILLAEQRIPDLTPEEHARALRVLDQLSHRPHSRFGFTEAEALERVWKRIEDPVNADRRDNLVYTLAKSLASGIEHDSVVCSTGRIMRILGALDGADAENIITIRSDQQINEELRQFVAHQRDTILGSWTEEERAKYEEDDPAIMETLRQQISLRAGQEYVGAGIMQQNVLDVKLKDLLAYL